MEADTATLLMHYNTKVSKIIARTGRGAGDGMEGNALLFSTKMFRKQTPDAG